MKRREFLQRVSLAAAGPVAFLSCRTQPSQPSVRLTPGRQLFVDDYLITTTDLTRVYHQAQYLDDNPVLFPDRPWEEAGSVTACAMPYGDGVLFDPQDRLFKMWYLGGMQRRHTCLAISADTYGWQKPDWGVVPGTNVVWPFHTTHGRDSQTLMRDPRDARYPYKMQSSGSGTLYSEQWLLGSPDGVHWTFLHETPPTGDRTTMFYDPFRERWIFSLRAGGTVGGAPRHREYVASPTFVPTEWSPIYWTGADALDSFRAGANGNPPQLYCLDATPYESLLLGLFTIFRGDLKDRPKLNDICLGFSRDGFEWHRPDRRPFISLGERGTWNYGNVQPAGGGCLVVGDTLKFFVSGRAGIDGTDEHGVCSTGVATLRRDGFASLEGTGSITTPPLTFDGRYLFINADIAGEVRVEVLDADFDVVTPAAACVPLTGDSTKHRVRFTDRDAIRADDAAPVRFRFVLDRARLFAFWLSDGPDGRSLGYLAGGGPEMNGEGRDAPTV